MWQVRTALYFLSKSCLPLKYSFEIKYFCVITFWGQPATQKMLILKAKVPTLQPCPDKKE